MRSASSRRRTGTPRWARSMAVHRPTGPAPTTTTGWRAGVARSWSGERRYVNWKSDLRPFTAQLRLALQRGPHLPVPLGRPDRRMVHARGFVVGPRDVERQAVLVDREGRKLR